jgi:fatty-acyl-CoA synthase
VSAIIVSDLHVADIIEMASIHKASKLITVGALHQKIVEHSDFKNKLSEQIVSLAGGGSGLTQTQFLRIESAYKNASFINGYGMTEAGGIIAIPRITDSMDIRSKATGMIYPGKTVRIMNGEGEILPAGSIGEVVVLDEGDLMKGYYNVPEDEQPFDDKGYFHTGDMGYIDEDNYLYLSGRIKDLIIRGGENISPLEVEKKISNNGNIKDCKVMGVPHPVFGESVVACVTCADDALFDESAIKDSLKGELASFKIPSVFFVFDSFPVAANGKTDQRALKIMMLDR